MRPEHELAAGSEVVRVVLHERRAAGEAGRHDLPDADERGHLPVALGAEPVPVSHQPLRGNAGKLPEAVEVLECVGERATAAFLEERAKRRLDACSFDE